MTGWDAAPKMLSALPLVQTVKKCVSLVIVEIPRKRSPKQTRVHRVWFHVSGLGAGAPSIACGSVKEAFNFSGNSGPQSEIPNLARVHAIAP